jgi:SAM-dependent methyltransferase
MDANNTREPWYTDRLQNLAGKRWKTQFDLQRFFKAPIKALALGKTLEVGCGVGRVLGWLPNSCGVDHNPTSVAVARSRGLTAFTNEEFHKSKMAIPESFDSIVMSHLLEHLDQNQIRAIMLEFRKYLKQSGRLVIICPQESGFRSDPTHITYMDFKSIEEYGESHNFEIVSAISNPFPRCFGHFFKYNEFFVVLKAL